MSSPVPVVLFAHSRVDPLRETLAGLQRDHIPLLCAYSDGPRSAEEAPKVAAVRRVLQDIDWCEVRLTSRAENWGLGRSVLAGVSEVLDRHPTAIVFEDDIVCRAGTYKYLSAALRHYEHVDEVMSITAWTHACVTPCDSAGQPYFDGRAECWGWATWARAWRGMLNQNAMQLIEACLAQRIDIYKYGADLPQQALSEQNKNIWAVRWLYWHILHGGLCLRPPSSLVANIGFDASATNTTDGDAWAEVLAPEQCEVPAQWPPAVENPACAVLWRRELGGPPSLLGWPRKVMSRIRRVLRRQ